MSSEGSEENSLAWGLNPRLVKNQKHSNIAYEINADKSYFFTDVFSECWDNKSVTNAI